MEKYPNPPLGHVNAIFRRKEKTWVVRVPTSWVLDPTVVGLQVDALIDSPACIPIGFLVCLVLA